MTFMGMPAPVIVVIAATTLWHGIAGVTFCFRPGRTIAVFTSERPVAPMAMWAMRFLGAMNFAVALPGIVALLAGVEPRWLVPLFFCAANLSQAIVDVLIHRAGVTNRRFAFTIFAGDVAATALNGAAAAALAFSGN